MMSTGVIPNAGQQATTANSRTGHSATAFPRVVQHILLAEHLFCNSLLRHDAIVVARNFSWFIRDHLRPSLEGMRDFDRTRQLAFSSTTMLPIRGSLPVLSHLFHSVCGGNDRTDTTKVLLEFGIDPNSTHRESPQSSSFFGHSGSMSAQCCHAYKTIWS